MPHKRIEDYGIIGDLHTVALVGVDGSIDWCCLPCFDSPSVFAALLDEDKGGYFKVNAVAASVYRQLYIPDTNVLVTRQLGDEGIAEIIDFMPIEARSERGEIAFRDTVGFWKSWISQSLYSGRWREMVHRSALVLKLLTYAPTGAIVAAPTTSLPETIGGARNWDYRYTWLRDAAFTLYSLLTLGFAEEARAFMGWLEARCHELGENGTLQPMYGIDGQHDLTEYTLDHLEGYRQSKPVRIGNNAYRQNQLDIYGELMDAIYIYNRYEVISYDLWRNLRRLLDWLCAHWQEPDEGIWEVRGGPRPFVHSRLMSWVAFDCALRLARQRGLPAPTDEWMQASAAIYEQIMHKGWNEKKHSFVQFYGSNAVDASALFMVLTKFTGATDPRILSTIDYIEKELTSDTLVHRYDPKLAADDGLGSREGTFTPCSFWMAESLARAGRLDHARLMLEKTLTYCNHVGLYSEEIGLTGEALGNFPQAFTHLSLITACSNIDQILNTTRAG